MASYPKYNDIIGSGCGPSTGRIAAIDYDPDRDYDPDYVGSLAETEINDHPDVDENNLPQNVDRHMEILNNGHILQGHPEYARTLNHTITRLNDHLQYNPDINRRILGSIDNRLLHDEDIPQSEQRIIRRSLRGDPPRLAPRTNQRYH